MFCKKRVLKNFAKIYWKNLCWSLFFKKVAGVTPATLLKRRLQHGCYPVNSAKFLRTTFFIELFIGQGLILPSVHQSHWENSVF